MISTDLILMGLRATQLLFAIILMGLTAYVTNWYNVDTLTMPPAQVAWLLFSSLFAIATVGYIELTARFVPKYSHVFAVLALESLAAVFHFAGLVALGVFLNSLFFCRGSVCGAARASVAFGAFEFALFSATAGMTAMTLLRSKRGGAPPAKTVQLEVREKDRLP
ncbi:membrane-associating domain-containing protein [Xylariaceae sp. FL0804]|nr:membrane-associating domain-containing protein [Xylariaceae sp. FL0804]